MISYVLSSPLFQSLYHAIRQDIESGVLEPYQKLPSKRQYALDLNISLSTVEQALDVLSQEGYIISKERQGYFVIPGNQKVSKDTFCLDPLPNDFSDPDMDFPLSLWFKTMRLVMSRDQLFLSQTSPAPGSARLRNIIAKYLYQNRQMQVQPRQIVIASGAQELYAILCRMFKKDFHVAIESPSYPVISHIYTSSNASVERLPLDRDGILPEALKKSKSQFLHVSPFSSFPDKIVTSPARRKLYLSWIQEKQGYLIEDDYNSEFFQHGPMLQTLYAMDNSHRVIYLNTFSKSLSPSLRLGYMVLPESLVPQYEKTAGKLACTVTMLEQFTLAEFIENGSFERLLVRRRRHQRAASKSVSGSSAVCQD